MKVHAVIVAAGTGSRTGLSQPKQFTLLAGRPVFRWSVDTLMSHAKISSVVLVLPAGEDVRPIPALPEWSGLMTIEGGQTRSESVLNGLSALDAEEHDLVLIHDAARPGLTHAVIDQLLEALTLADAAAPALPVNDALKRRDSNSLSDVSRHDLYRVQTPQAFRIGRIRQALSRRGTDFVDDLAAVEAEGASVALIQGSERLHKLTYKLDFEILEAILSGPPAHAFRTGSGYDVHGFIEGDGVRLCGVDIPHDKSLSGFSDADVGWHALTDAIFGSLAMGDLGDHFPPGDERWKEADSALFLKHAARLASQEGWVIANADITLICEAPKIKPYRSAMRQRTAEILGLSPDQISIKATTTEGLGFTGRREGIAAQAVVMLSRPRH